jgi:alanyl-tRNA synthetase
VTSNIPTTAASIRQVFMDFFAARGHRVVRSHAVIPPNDPTLYFVNAGMVQFKDVFIGATQVDYTTATSCQKCLRVSGKHNDLENVGRTARHHTLFEMLGNFSFGDYFKSGAIDHAWEFLTEVMGLSAEELHVSVHPDDEEAYGLWRDRVGVSEERIHRDPENFWSMGDTGPCGPCSEIHIDLGPSMSGGVEVPYGDPAGEHRYLELWNLVFMQFDRDAAGTMTPLPKPSIDTGMGLERLVAVAQGKTSNFDTDLFQPIMGRVAARAELEYGDDEEQDVALRVIADHSRATAFLIADGVYPDNEGRGYVLRRIMRRAIRFGRMIGIEEPFLIDTTAHVIEMMGEAYPELVAGAETIRRIVLREEERFGNTISLGTKRLDEALAGLDEGGQLDGRVAFELYDTHGFPPDLTALIAGERGVSVDQGAFDEAMNEQRERARAASRFGDGDLSAYQAMSEEGLTTTFVGYDAETARSAVGAILVDGSRVEFAAAGSRVEFVTRETPFYAESGGQVGDRGRAVGEGVTLEITDTRRPYGEVVVHIAEVVGGRIETGTELSLEVDHEAREATRRNHSATHLMHDALRKILGDHVRQRGSLVAPDRLRFDFSHLAGLTPEEILAVEIEVNRHVLANEPIETDLLAYDDAIAAGAIAFFEEKYTDEVRMLRVGSESVELCGGTHAAATGDIGLFKIISEGAISSGVRRLEAVTGLGAARWVQQRDAILRLAAEHLHTGPEGVPERVAQLLAERKTLSQALERTQTELQVARAASAVDDAREVGGKRLAAVRLDGVSGKSLRGIGESLRDRIGSGAVFIAAVDGEKVSLLVAVTPDASEALHAGRLVGDLAPLVGGKGGGRPDMAQAGGGDSSGIDRAIEAFYETATTALSGS